MWIYFSKDQGRQGTLCPHGQAVRQGGDFDIVVAFEQGRVVEEGIQHIRVLYKRPGDASATPLDQLDPSQVILQQFTKINPYEATFDLKDNQIYETFHWAVGVDKLATAKSGKLELSIQADCIVPDENQVAQQVTKVFGTVEAFVEPTLRYQVPNGISPSSYETLLNELKQNCYAISTVFVAATGSTLNNTICRTIHGLTQFSGQLVYGGETPAAGTWVKIAEADGTGRTLIGGKAKFKGYHYYQPSSSVIQTTEVDFIVSQAGAGATIELYCSGCQQSYGYDFDGSFGMKIEWEESGLALTETTSVPDLYYANWSSASQVGSLKSKHFADNEIQVDRAVKDGNGNDISNTYLTKTEISSTDVYIDY